MVFSEKYRIPPVSSNDISDRVYLAAPAEAIKHFLCSQSQRETEMLSSVSLLLIVQPVKTLLSEAFDALLLFKCTWKNVSQHSVVTLSPLTPGADAVQPHSGGPAHTHTETHTHTHILTFGLALIASF